MRQLLALFGTAALIAGAAATPVLSLVPETDKVHPPENVYVDVILSGLDHVDPSSLLGAFDLTIHYTSQSMIFQPIGSSLGSGLGDPADPTQTLIGSNNDTPGVFRFFEVSLLEATHSGCLFCTGPYLEDLQNTDSLLLARLLFYSPGKVGDFATFIAPRDEVILSDANGVQITDFAIVNGMVPLPEPTDLMLVATALLAATAFRRRPLR
jgi:hypothetical protein